MNKEEIIIFGTSKVAEIVYSSIKDDPGSRYSPVAFTVDQEYKREDEKFGLPVISFEEAEKRYPPVKYHMIVAIGYHEMNRVRAEKCRQAKEKGYELVSFIHTNADISGSAEIGRNCMILGNVSIGPYARIGDNVCIYSGATVSHHVTIEDNVWITSGSVIGGNSRIGKNCFLGINCTVAHNIDIGADNFIGTSAVVTKNTEDNGVYIVADTPRYRLSTERFMKLFGFE